MKKSSIILAWGIGTAIACIIYITILSINEMSLSGWHYFNILIVFLGFFLGIRQYRDKANGGYLDFGQGYIVSLWMTLVLTIIGLVSIVITLQVEPDLGSKLLNELQAKLINSGLEEDKIEKIMNAYAKGFTPRGMIERNIIGNIFTGAILGLIATGINTRKKPMFEDVNETLPNP